MSALCPGPGKSPAILTLVTELIVLFTAAEPWLPWLPAGNSSHWLTTARWWCSHYVAEKCIIWWKNDSSISVHSPQFWRKDCSQAWRTGKPMLQNPAAALIVIESVVVRPQLCNFYHLSEHAAVSWALIAARMCGGRINSLVTIVSRANNLLINWSTAG